MFQTNIFAAKGEKSVSFSSLYSTYSDLKLSDATAATPTDIEPSVDVEMGIRVFGPFNFLFSAGQSIDQKRSTFGIGVRADLPGFFFIGAKKKDLINSKKKYPINTSGFFSTYVVQTKGATAAESSTASSASRWGLTIEAFLFNNFTYLILEISVFSLGGNIYTSPVFGLGVNF